MSESIQNKPVGNLICHQIFTPHHPIHVMGGRGWGGDSLPHFVELDHVT